MKRQLKSRTTSRKGGKSATRSQAHLGITIMHAVKIAIVTSLLLCFSGCGRDTAQVSGKVQFTDGSAPVGEIRVIRFEPTEDSPAETRKAAFADLEEDGTFELFTRKPGDGVYLGKYKVTFTVFKTAMGRENNIPELYTFAQTSPFTVEVKDDMRDLVFELER